MSTRCWRLLLLLCAALWCCGSGCLFVRHSTRVVREKEAIHPIRFESEQAKSVFEAGVHELQARKENSGGDVVAVPFLCWYSHLNQLSDNAIYNDQESACDLNGDAFITLDEALAYRAKVDERVAAADKAKPAESKSDSGGPPSAASPPVARRPADFTPPPGLIH